MIDQKPFYEILVKDKEETYETIIEMSKNNNYTTGNSLDYEYFSKHYKLISIDLSKQIELENTDLKQQINFIGRLEQIATIFVIIEKEEDTIFDFSQDCDCFLVCIEMEAQKIINLLEETDDKFFKICNNKKWYIKRSK